MLYQLSANGLPFHVRYRRPSRIHQQTTRLALLRVYTHTLLVNQTITPMRTTEHSLPLGGLMGILPLQYVSNLYYLSNRI